MSKATTCSDAAYGQKNGNRCGVTGSGCASAFALVEEEFNTAVGLPGVSLARGTYMFRYLGEGRSAIQVLNADGSVSYGLFLPTTIRRTGTVNDGAVWLMPPAAAGGPRRVQALFEPGLSTGSGFGYR